MNHGEFASAASLPAKHLPPRERWLYDPAKEGRIPTPVDEHGLIDKRQLIKLVKQTVDPTYDWESGFSDVHHLYWPNRWYENRPDDESDPQLFRNLTSSKIKATRLFHNHLHYITEPVDIPDPEVRLYQIQDHLARRALVQSMQSTRNLLRGHISDLRRQRGFEYHLQEFFAIKDRIAELPPAFRSIDLTPFEPESVEEFPEIARQIKLAKHATMATVHPIAARRRSLASTENAEAA